MRLLSGWIMIILLAALVYPSAAQKVWEFPDFFEITWHQKDQRSVFKPGELYRHINGAAEFFLELGFDSLQVQSYSDGKRELVFEVFEMGRTSAAYAAYLKHRVSPSVLNEDLLTFSVNRYQTVLCTGNFYIQIINPSGDTSLVKTMKNLGKDLAGEIDAEILSLLERLPPDNRVPGTLALFNGPLSLRPMLVVNTKNFLPQSANYFGIAAQYYNQSGQNFLKIIIPYPDPVGARSAMTAFVDQDKTCIEIIKVASDRVEFRTCDLKKAEMRLFAETLIIEIE